MTLETFAIIFVAGPLMLSVVLGIIQTQFIDTRWLGLAAMWSLVLAIVMFGVVIAIDVLT